MLAEGLSEQSVPFLGGSCAYQGCKIQANFCLVGICVSTLIFISLNPEKKLPYPDILLR